MSLRITERELEGFNAALAASCITALRRLMRAAGKILTRRRRASNITASRLKMSIGSPSQGSAPHRGDHAARAGLDECHVADLLAQKKPSMAWLNSRSANLAGKNREKLATLEKDNARRAKIVRPFTEKRQARSQ
ncbi:hypothetical protein [Rhodovulum strictum]|uniref:Uncharacterized protein n=1 Tax=Rhodovulum strictum TaxID=58314 RepID=A0A844BJG8_9RHOB|nr:hypothetical protein [Rhodovulum strictum]MRH22608.1 hypothetical protein [Rhodovulum strictum]